MRASHFFVLLASYIGSVLFRALAFTDAKLASGVPAVIGHFDPNRVQFRSFELTLGAGPLLT